MSLHLVTFKYVFIIPLSTRDRARKGARQPFNLGDLRVSLERVSPLRPGVCFLSPDELLLCSHICNPGVKYHAADIQVIGLLIVDV